MPSGAACTGPNPARKGGAVSSLKTCTLFLSFQFLCPFPVKSTGEKFGSFDLNINIKVQLETIILAQ